jgi:hypothetical protein
MSISFLLPFATIISLELTFMFLAYSLMSPEYDCVVHFFNSSSFVLDDLLRKISLSSSIISGSA